MARAIPWKPAAIDFPIHAIKAVLGGNADAKAPDITAERGPEIRHGDVGGG